MYKGIFKSKLLKMIIINIKNRPKYIAHFFAPESINLVSNLKVFLIIFEKLEIKLYELNFDKRIVKSINKKQKINLFEIIKNNPTKQVIKKAVNNNFFIKNPQHKIQ